MPKILNILLGLFTRNLRSNILIMALVAIWIGFGIATPTFWSADNVQNVLPQMAIIAIMACGMVFVIVTGGIDLSVGFGAGFVSVVAAALLYFGVIDGPLQSLFPTLASARLELVTMLITVILCMGLGLLMGLFQGYIIARLSVPPFIVTLGTMSIARGAALLFTEGRPVSGFDASFRVLATGRAGFVPGGFASNDYGDHSPGGYSLLAGFCAETVFAFFFLLIILGTTDSRAPQGFAPLAIGLAVALINWAGIPVTNLSLNPARSTGTAVFADGWALQQLWLFWVAPILGGAVAGVVYPFLAGSPPSMW